MECETSHFICHTSRKTNHLCSTTLFSQDAEYNAKSQSRHKGENRQVIALATNLSLSISLLISLSLALSLALLSRSLAFFSFSSLSLSHSICSSDGPSIPLSFPLSVSVYLLLSVSLSFSHNHSLSRSDSLISLFLSHELAHSIRITSHINYYYRTSNKLSCFREVPLSKYLSGRH